MPTNDRLESWKEIAAYLGRGVRTVHRWEQEEGLPVHRLTHTKSASVYAFRSELDEWRNQRSAPSQTNEVAGNQDAALVPARNAETFAPPVAIPPTHAILYDPASIRPWGGVIASLALLLAVLIIALSHFHIEVRLGANSGTRTKSQLHPVKIERNCEMPKELV